MKRITSLPRIAAVSLLFGALAACILAFSLTRSAIGSPDNRITPAPLGVIETDGTLDTTFNAGTFTNGFVFASTYQSDGKLLIAGQFTRVHGVGRAGIARLNTDGTLDTSFDPGTGSNSGVGGVLVQPDGKILIWEFFTIFNADSGLASLVRLKSDGSTDSSFNVGHKLGSNNSVNVASVFAVVRQADGKIVVGGQFDFVITPSGNVNRSRVARFNSDGTFDPTFDPGAGTFSNFGGDSNFVFQAAAQSIGPNAGKIIIQGSFDLFDNHPASGMARLNTDGSFDSTFNPGTATGGFGQSVFGILVQSDDRPVVFGMFDSWSGSMCSDIVRLNSDGSIDGGFHTAAFSWYGNLPFIFGAALLPDGKILVGGDFHSLGAATTNNVARLNTDGTRDATFSAIGGGPSAAQVYTVAVRSSDGKIFLGGNFSTYGGEVRNNVALANTDGTVDNTFAGLAGATDHDPNILAMVEQPDGKILLTGYFNSVNGTPHYNVLRLNPDAMVDSSFNVNTDRIPPALFLQPDGKIVIAGNFGEVNGVPRSRIARLDADGTLDLTFDPGTGADRFIHALAQDSAGNIYAGGDFSVFNGIPRRGIVKLTPTGAVDSAFNPAGGGANSPQVQAITPPDSAGHIVIGGNFTTYNGTSARRIARIDTTTGAIDSTFQAGTGTGFSGGPVSALQAAPDGKYYAGGNFNSFNGVTRYLVARLNNDGTLDFDFEGPAFDGIIYSLAVQNGKVYVGGEDYFAGQAIMVRLTGSGALDSTFDTGKGFDVLPLYSYGQFTASISAMAIQADGKLLVGGIFNQYNHTPRICLARLTGPLTPPSSPTPTPTATPTPTPSATPTPTPTPGPSPGAQAVNLSTRMRVQTGDNVGIGGFVITGTAPKHVLLRAIGPFSIRGLPGVLEDPVLELHGPAGFTTVTNNNWQDDPAQALLIQASGLAPTRNLESAIDATLPPGAYTGVVSGNGGTSGIGLVEVYDLSQAVLAKLANISTRALVGTNSDIVFAGFILGNNSGSTRIVLRGIGGSLTIVGVPNPLANPNLELRNSSGALLASNDDWQSDPAQAAQLTAAGLAPTNTLESGIAITLGPGQYTALLAGQGTTTGVGVIEVYDRGP